MKYMIHQVKSKPRKNLKKDSFQNLLDGTKIWAEYWRKNPHRFAVEYLQLNLYWFQMVLIYTMNICNIFCFIACRGESFATLNRNVYVKELFEIGEG